MKSHSRPPESPRDDVARNSPASGGSPVRGNDSPIGTPTSQPPCFTPKQGEYLSFIAFYTLLHGRAPAESEIQAYFGVTPPAVHDMVIKLERDGLIRRTPGKARSIEVLVPPENLPIPSPRRTS